MLMLTEVNHFIIFVLQNCNCYFSYIPGLNVNEIMKVNH